MVQIINQPQQQYATVSTISTQQRQLIPVNFVQLESRRRNYLGAAEEFDNKSGHERYYFFHGGKGHNLDLSFELVEQLGLTRGQNCEHTVYVSNEVLNRNPEEGGITIDNPEDITIVKPGTILEREVQTDENSLITELKEENQVQEELLEIKNTQIANLVRERRELIQATDELQGRLDEANNTIDDLQTDLTTEQNSRQAAEQQRDQLRQELQRITVERAQARRSLQNEQETLQQTQNQLTSANDNLRGLTNQRINLQAIINNAQVSLGVDDLGDLPALPQGDDLHSLLDRPTREQLQNEQAIRQNTEQQLEQIQQELQEKIVELNNERGDNRPNVSSTTYTQLCNEKEELERKFQELSELVSIYQLSSHYTFNFSLKDEESINRVQEILNN